MSVTRTAAPPLSRRAVVALGVGALSGIALTTSGCSALEDATEGLFGGGEEPPPGAVTPSEPATDADSDLVDETGASIAATAAVVAAVGERVPTLASVADTFGAVHAAHLAELGYDEPVDPVTVRANRRNGRRTILAAELTLQEQLVEAAQLARSGALAQVFASMAASLAQHRAVSA